MAAHREYRTVIICDHNRPYRAEGSRRGCDGERGRRLVIHSAATYRNADDARDAGYQHIEYADGWNHSAHYVGTQSRLIHDWEDD